MMSLCVLLCCCMTTTSASQSHFAALFPVLSNDVVAQFGRSAIIPFGWSGEDPFEIYHYMRNESVKQFVYTRGKSMIGDGYSVNRNNSGHHYKLIIETIRHDHAGTYNLVVGGSVASRRYLTVITGPSCKADRTSNPHEAYYQCSLQHTGPAQPVIEWPELGECSETDTSNTHDSAGVSVQTSLCTMAVPHANEHVLHLSKTCVLSFLDAHMHKLRQTYTCTTVMPLQATTSSYRWLGTSDIMYIRLGHIMYLILLGVSLFMIYCLRSPVTWLLRRLCRWRNCPLPNGHNSNRMKQDSSELNTALQVMDN